MRAPPPLVVQRIREALEEAEGAMWDGADLHGYPVYVKRKSGAIYADPSSALTSLLTNIFLKLRVMAEAMGQSECLAEIKAFDTANRSKYGDVKFDANADCVFAPGLEEARRFFGTLTEAVDHSAGEAPFENIIRATATILHNADVVPTNEREVRDEVFGILKHAYPDVSRSTEIRHPGKNYVPDFTSIAAQSYAEFKFVKARAGLGPVYDQIAGDMLGYKGNPTIRFKFAVIFLASPFATEAEVKAHFRSIGKPDDWTIIVQHGSGES